MIMTDYGVDGHFCVQQSTGLRPRDRYDVPAHVSYGGMAGPEGVVFVEGRKNLSAGVDHRTRGLPTPSDPSRPYAPVIWTGARARVVEYESRDYTSGDSNRTADSFGSGYSSTSAFSIDSVSSRSSLPPVEGPYEYDDDSSPVRFPWTWLWQRYWYGSR